MFFLFLGRFFKGFVVFFFLGGGGGGFLRVFCMFLLLFFLRPIGNPLLYLILLKVIFLFWALLRVLKQIQVYYRELW